MACSFSDNIPNAIADMLWVRDSSVLMDIHIIDWFEEECLFLQLVFLYAQGMFFSGEHNVQYWIICLINSLSISLTLAIFLA